MSNNTGFIIQESQVVQLFEATQGLARLGKVLSGGNRKTVNILDDFASSVGDVVSSIITEHDSEDDFNDLFVNLVYSDVDAVAAVERLKEFAVEMKNRSQYGPPALEAIS